MLRAVLFDLDGTLLDTLDDLTDAVNGALEALGLLPRGREEVRRFVGDGAQALMERALGEARKELTGQALALFRERYAARMAVKTRPYPGVIALLDALGARGVKIGVVSNKPDGAAVTLCERFFPGRIDLSMGERWGMPRKPAPDGCLEVLRALGVQPDSAVYVGDTVIDVQTARGAGMRAAAVSWGYRDREELAGADWIVDDAGQLLRVLEEA